MKFLIILLLLAGCADDDGPSAEMIMAKSEIDELRSRLRMALDHNAYLSMMNYERACKDHPTTLEAKKQGCEHFKKFLKSDGIKLSEYGWQVCDEFNTVRAK